MDRRGPTWDELADVASRLPGDQGKRLLARASPAMQRPGPEAAQAGAPVYISWADFLAQTSVAERRKWCAAKAKKANKERLMSGTPAIRITAQDVLGVLDAAQGRCAYCSSLAVERRPSTPRGAPTPWEHVGRRIGSLNHRISLFNSGSNAPENLCWSCLWCNTWPSERRPGAVDHGGIQFTT